MVATPLKSKPMYHPTLLNHFEHPRNVGELAAADARVTVENPACGDVMLLTIKVADGTITDVRFRTKGCVASIACGSRLTEMIIGQRVEHARALDRNQLVASLGGLSNETMHASHLAFEALSSALRQLQ
jgi:nitrogen fixation protein NifU and related proteins